MLLKDETLDLKVDVQTLNFRELEINFWYLVTNWL